MVISSQRPLRSCLRALQLYYLAAMQLIISVLTIALQAVRATMINPADSFGSEKLQIKEIIVVG